MVEAIQLTSTFMQRTMEYLKNLVNHTLQRIQIPQNAQISTSAKIVQESKEKILIIKVTAGRNQDIKCGKLSNMVKLLELNK